MPREKPQSSLTKKKKEKKKSGDDNDTDGRPAESYEINEQWH